MQSPPSALPAFAREDVNLGTSEDAKLTENRKKNPRACEGGEYQLGHSIQESQQHLTAAG